MKALEKYEVSKTENRRSELLRLIKAQYEDLYSQLLPFLIQSLESMDNPPTYVLMTNGKGYFSEEQVDRINLKTMANPSILIQDMICWHYSSPCVMRVLVVNLI